MTQTLVAVFDSMNEAQAAAKNLATMSYNDADIQVHADNSTNNMSTMPSGQTAKQDEG